jgi:hypothetical protein
VGPKIGAGVPASSLLGRRCRPHWRTIDSALVSMRPQDRSTMRRPAPDKHPDVVGKIRERYELPDVRTPTDERRAVAASFRTIEYLMMALEKSGNGLCLQNGTAGRRDQLVVTMPGHRDPPQHFPTSSHHQPYVQRRKPRHANIKLYGRQKKSLGTAPA